MNDNYQPCACESDALADFNSLSHSKWLCRYQPGQTPLTQLAVHTPTPIDYERIIKAMSNGWILVVSHHFQRHHEISQNLGLLESTPSKRCHLGESNDFDRFVGLIIFTKTAIWCYTVSQMLNFFHLKTHIHPGKLTWNPKWRFGR